MAKWERGEFDSKAKVRIIVMVDPSDPENEELLAMHKAIPWGEGNNTYLRILRESAKGRAGMQGVRRGVAKAEPQKPAVNTSKPVTPAADDVEVDTSKKGDSQGESLIMGKTISDESRSIVGDQHLSNSTADSQASKKIAFSNRAAGQFEIADDD